jgi:hypothetical protein
MIEIPLRKKYLIGGSAKKSKIPGNGNSGTGQTKPALPLGIPRHYRGRTRYK